MSSSQVTAGVALLRKVLPDLSQTTLEGGDNPVQIETVRREIVRPRPVDPNG